MNWQPIKTAPKDGTRILVWCDKCEFVQWQNDGWEGADGWHCDPSHWQPEPEPPK